MADDFKYDIFLSYSPKDKAAVRPLAERLRADGLRVWYDEWELKPGDHIPQKVEEGLEHSRVLLLCMSTHALGSDWATLESQTFRFRDPLNRYRRFIPLHLDDSPIRGSLAQFSYINWLPRARKQSYPKLLEACLSTSERALPGAEPAREQGAEKSFRLDSVAKIRAYALCPSGRSVFTGADDNVLRLWDTRTGRCLVEFDGGGRGDLLS